jgi:hypothetical protein
LFCLRNITYQVLLAILQNFTNIFLVFYPKAFQQQNYGFLNHCPYDIQRQIIDQIILWNDSQTISSVLWESNSSQIMLEIIRQSSLLPVNKENAETIKKSIDFYKKLLTVKI